MNDNILISIIIPIYNTEKYLNECLESVIKQTYKNIEIILLNDGSTDDSLKICKKYASKDKRIKVNDMDNFGVSHARNVGLSIATGEFIAFVDSDDTIEPEFIETLYNACNNNKTKISVVNVNYCYENSIKQPLKMQTEIVDVNKYYELLLYSVKGFCCNKLYHKSVVSNVVFDESISICEDLLFNIQIAAMTDKISVVNKYLYNYRQGSNGAYNKVYNRNKVTEIYSYDRVLSLIEKQCPVVLDLYKYEYLIMAITQRIQYINSDYRNKKIFSIIQESIKRYYKEVFKSKRIKILRKIYVVIYDKCYKLIKFLKIIKNKVM